MEFSYSQTENFEIEKLSSDIEYFKKPVEINRGIIHGYYWINVFCEMPGCKKLGMILDDD